MFSLGVSLARCTNGVLVIYSVNREKSRREDKKG